LTPTKHFILIPVYNDWKSLNKLLSQIDETFNNEKLFDVEILVVNDCSTDKIDINHKENISIKKISVLNSKKNLGSQKAIALGLCYLKNLNQDSFITVMDSDGEDNPFKIKEMLKMAEQNKNHIITSNRKQRKESLQIVFCYYLHLVLTFLFSFQWVSFGNFTTFSSRNLSNLLSNNCSWYAHSSSVMYNCNIKRLYAKREKRYFDKSKLNFKSLIEHSFRVNVVFFKRIFITSIFYSTLVYLIIPVYFNYFLIILILIFNIILLLVKKKHYRKDLTEVENYFGKIISF
jgi:polyisoprenyl-phosphate glycosyltransferase